MTVVYIRVLFVIEGSDFTLMCQLFPNRNRTDIKRKFKREEKYNPGKYQRKNIKVHVARNLWL